MRHFEEFEMEHLLNSTGSLLMRWCCRFHLKRCEICRNRMDKVLADRNFAMRFKAGIEHLRSNTPPEDIQP